MAWRSGTAVPRHAGTRQSGTPAPGAAGRPARRDDTPAPRRDDTPGRHAGTPPERPGGQPFRILRSRQLASGRFVVYRNHNI